MKTGKLIGDRAFYGRLLTIMTPILIQNIITNFVSLLDNIMVGQVGTEPMSGVAIVNQLIFVFSLCMWGGLAGAGIFTAQYYGKNDSEGVKHTFRLKLIIAAVIALVSAGVFIFFGEPLIAQFLHKGQDELDLAATMGFAKDYLRVIIWQIPLFALSQSYATTLRETGETVLPMKAGIAAVFVNMTFNYILIFGKLGAPVMGVTGAAIATVMSRVVECLIVVIWTHRHKERCRFIRGAYSTLRVPGQLLRSVLLMGMPLLINEFLWSTGMTVLNQCYSVRGLEVVSAFNIFVTIQDLFFCAQFAIGSTISIVIGSLLGAGELERAVDEDAKLIAFAVALNVVLGAAMALVSPYIPQMYNTTDTVKNIARELLLVGALTLPMHSFTHACYFTLRSGGKTLITFIFDSAYLWALDVPAAFLLSRFTELPIIQMYLAIQLLELLKCGVGFVLVKKRKWVKNLVGHEPV